jgi:hypothetical protein
VARRLSWSGSFQRQQKTSCRGRRFFCEREETLAVK